MAVGKINVNRDGLFSMSWCVNILDMSQKDPRVDAYIENAAPFSKPILTYLRSTIHKAVPSVSETIKWGFPHFEYHGLLCQVAAFKEHCTFRFWKGTLLEDALETLNPVGKTAMGHFGRIQTLEDLPSDSVLHDLLQQAASLNEKGLKVPTKSKTAEKKELVIPSYFLELLAENPLAQKTFESLSYSHKKEYVEWITEAKTEITREKRLATAIEWLSEGKIRHWKYVNC